MGNISLNIPGIGHPIVFSEEIVDVPDTNLKGKSSESTLQVEETKTKSEENFLYSSNAKNDLFLPYSSSYFTSEKIYPSSEETREIYNKKIQDPSFGNIDFRSLKSQRLSDSFCNKLAEKINANAELRADCSDAIASSVQEILKNIPLYLSNKACNVDPAKWILYRTQSNKHIIFGKYVAIDIDENVLFEMLGLNDKKLRAQKLELISDYHAAMKSGNNKSINYTVQNLKNHWFAELLPKYKDIVIGTSHKIYWTPLGIEMLPVYNSYFGTIPVADWFYYPFYMISRHMFSRSEPDMDFLVGPPSGCLKSPPYPAKILCQIGVFLEYSASLFGGKVTFKRNGKEY
jgi:hypothetical protein